jgi:hypothetical protein
MMICPFETRDQQPSHWVSWTHSPQNIVAEVEARHHANVLNQPAKKAATALERGDATMKVKWYWPPLEG